MQHTSSIAQCSVAPTPVRARRLLWLIFILMILNVSIGRAWDAIWHATYTFDGFWSPPHVFIYVMTTLIALLVMRLVFSPRLRHSFGEGFQLNFLAFPIPGSLFLLSASFVSVGIAGMILDNLWHTLFGLNETSWSAPHAMIGQSLLLMTLAFISCRFALRSSKPIGWFTRLLFGILLIGVTRGFLGPLADYHTPDTIRAVASIPALAQQPPAQHSYRIALVWNLTRSNPALIVAGAFWAGAVLSLVRALDRRNWFFLLLVSIWTLLQLRDEYSAAEILDRFWPLVHNPLAWMPLPLLPAAMTFVAMRLFRASEAAAWTAAGVVFGLAVFLIWGAPGWALALLVLAGPAARVGASIGERVFSIIEQPDARSSWLLVLALVVLVPIITGIIDLILRIITL
jgi:hypothetical protein